MSRHHTLIFDSTQPFNLPADVFCIAYYGGDYQWSDAAIARARAVYRLCEHPASITRETMSKCRGVGVEPGALSVAQAIQACIWRHDAGHKDFTVYTSAGRGADPDFQPGMVGIIQTLRAHAPGLPFRLHIAEWDGNPGARPVAEGVEAWAKQYEGNVHGGAYDLSVLYGTNDLVTR